MLTRIKYLFITIVCCMPFATWAQHLAGLAGSGGAIFELAQAGYDTMQLPLKIAVSDYDYVAYKTGTRTNLVKHWLLSNETAFGHHLKDYGEAAGADHEYFKRTSSARGYLQTKTTEKEADSLENTLKQFYSVRSKLVYGFLIDTLHNSKLRYGGLDFIQTSADVVPQHYFSKDLSTRYYTFDATTILVPLKENMDADSLYNHFSASDKAGLLLQRCASNDTLTVITQSLVYVDVRENAYHYTCNLYRGRRPQVDSLPDPDNQAYYYLETPLKDSTQFANKLLWDLIIVMGKSVDQNKTVNDPNGCIIYDQLYRQRYSLHYRGKKLKKIKINATGTFSIEEIKEYLKTWMFDYKEITQRPVAAICSEQKWEVRKTANSLISNSTACNGPGLPPSILFYFIAHLKPVIEKEQ